MTDNSSEELPDDRPPQRTGESILILAESYALLCDGRAVDPKPDAAGPPAPMTPPTKRVRRGQEAAGPSSTPQRRYSSRPFALQDNLSEPVHLKVCAVTDGRIRIEDCIAALDDFCWNPDLYETLTWSTFLTSIAQHVEVEIEDVLPFKAALAGAFKERVGMESVTPSLDTRTQDEADFEAKAEAECERACFLRRRLLHVRRLHGWPTLSKGSLAV